MDNMVVYSKTLDDYIYYLKAVFDLFQRRRIIFNPEKSFIGYPSVELLGQKIDRFGLSTSTEKLATI